MTEQIRHKLCVAPMIQYTDMHDRYLLRLISKKVFLYTEMIATGSLIFGKCYDQLEFNSEEHPVGVEPRHGAAVQIWTGEDLGPAPRDRRHARNPGVAPRIAVGHGDDTEAPARRAPPGKRPRRHRVVSRRAQHPRTIRRVCRRVCAAKASPPRPAPGAPSRASGSDALTKRSERSGRRARFAHGRAEE